MEIFINYLVLQYTIYKANITENFFGRAIVGAVIIKLPGTLKLY